MKGRFQRIGSRADHSGSRRSSSGGITAASKVSALRGRQADGQRRDLLPNQQTRVVFLAFNFSRLLNRIVLVIGSGSKEPLRNEAETSCEHAIGQRY